MTDPVSLASRLEFALRASREAQTLILGHYQKADLHVDRKADRSPVTEADRGTEQLLRDRLAESFPDDAILGEELPDRPGTSGYRWILDPIDGTKSFIHGVPLFGTLIGLESGDDCVMGVCRFPALNEVVYAARGQGAWWQIGDLAPRQVHVSKVTQYSEATVCTTNPARWITMGRAATFAELTTTALLARGWGDCYGHMLVATGRADVMVDPALNAWDAAAVLPIVEEAGGCFVDWTGRATIRGGNGVSVTPGLKGQTLAILARS